eukprot:gene5998-7459_t
MSYVARADPTKSGLYKNDKSLLARDDQDRLKMSVFVFFVILSLLVSASAWTMEQEIADQVIKKISKIIVTHDDISAFTSGTEQEGVEKIINYLGNAVEEDRRQLQAQPDHEGLDDTCTSKLCDYLKYQLS